MQPTDSLFYSHPLDSKTLRPRVPFRRWSEYQLLLWYKPNPTSWLPNSDVSNLSYASCVIGASHKQPHVRYHPFALLALALVADLSAQTGKISADLLQALANPLGSGRLPFYSILLHCGLRLLPRGAPTWCGEAMPYGVAALSGMEMQSGVVTPSGAEAQIQPPVFVATSNPDPIYFP
jgi:hypothetical protein